TPERIEMKTTIDGNGIKEVGSKSLRLVRSITITAENFQEELELTMLTQAIREMLDELHPGTTLEEVIKKTPQLPNQN
ncbi:MAG TPA: hypothetical protein VEF04_09570, partial [Blastocatellia bacterium]|nr:hypothetical protein [Blastocatellia bacterium]